MSKEYNSDWNLQRLTLPIEIEGTTVYRPYPSGDLLICVDDNEGTSHASLKDLQLYEKQRRLISCESLIGCLIEILYKFNRISHMRTNFDLISGISTTIEFRPAWGVDRISVRSN